MFTVSVARTLARLLPENVPGSISTVPVGYRARFRAPDDEIMAARRLVDVAGDLRRIEDETGKQVVLALEPEPDCVLETARDAVRFFEERLLRETREESVIRRYLGVCLDTSHLAVRFCSAASAIRELQAAGIVPAKIQLSAALAGRSSPRARVALRAFSDETYLHQVTSRRADGFLQTWPDLPEAIDQIPEGAEFRVHFHAPLHWEGNRELRSTSEELDTEFFGLLLAGACPHLETETYTFEVLPGRPGDVVDCVAGELEWVLARFRRLQSDGNGLF